jgi:tRNA(Ile)-lysidine synthase
MLFERTLAVEQSFNPNPYKPLRAAIDFLRSLKGAQKLLVAISGGSDSTGILLAFHQALTLPEFSVFRLCAVTVDHGLRAESAAEARTVAALCAQLNVRHLTKVWQGVKPKSGLSQASRTARYHLLAESATELGADLILLGHTIGDQRETITMRRQRSMDADSAGLAGMAPAVLLNRQTWACRPFLNIERSDIRDYLSSNAVDWIDDPSNDNPSYERVRVRQAAQDDRLAANYHIATERYRLSASAAKWFETSVVVHPNGLIALDRIAVLSHPQEARYALSLLAAITGGREYAMGRQSLDQLWALISAEGNARFSAHRTLFDIRKTMIFLCRENRDLPSVPERAALPMLWDERYYLSELPDQKEAAEVSQQIIARSNYVPQALMRKAEAAMPFRASADEVSSPAYRIDPCMRPFDRFLPLFDHAFASTVSHAFGCSALADVPFTAPAMSLIEKGVSF